MAATCLVFADRAGWAKYSAEAAILPELRMRTPETSGIQKDGQN